MEFLARSSRSLILLCILCACGLVAHGQSNSVSIGIGSLIVQGEVNQFRSALPFHIVAAPAYIYSITGNVHGEGPIFSQLVPSSVPAATAFESIHQGLSSALQGSVSNPGGQLHADILSEQVSSGTNGVFNATFAISIDDNGVAEFDVTNVALVINGQPDTTDRLVFDSGNVTITALFADVSAATLSATGITTHGATLRSSIVCPNNFQAYFVYSADTSYSSTSSSVSLVTSGSAQTISIPVTGLLPHQIYHFKAVGADITGPTLGTAQTFKTLDSLPVTGTFSAFAGLTTTTIPVLAHSSDPDGDPLKVIAVGKGTAGKSAVKSGGSAVTFQFTSGKTATDHFSYSVGDPFGGLSTGQVNVVNYATLAGTYSAVLLDPASQDAGAGYLRLTLSTSGFCTGSLTIAGVTYSFTGALDSAGHLSKTLNSSAPLGTTITLDMIQGGGGYLLSAGVVMNTMYLMATLPKAASVVTGAFTMLIPPPLGASYVGSGYGLVAIAPSGLATISGALADGAPFSCAGIMDASGRVGVYSLLYAKSNRGSLAGTLAVTGSAGASISGTLVWTKPAFSTSVIDQGPFTMTLTGSGSRYASVKNTPALQFGTVGNTGHVSLLGGNLNSPILHGLAILPTNKVTILGAGNATLALTIQPANGMLSGHFVDSLTGQTRQIHGILLQGSNTGGGYFLGDSMGGMIGIAP